MRRKGTSYGSDEDFLNGIEDISSPIGRNTGSQKSSGIFSPEIKAKLGSSVSNSGGTGGIPSSFLQGADESPLVSEADLGGDDLIPSRVQRKVKPWADDGMASIESSRAARETDSGYNYVDDTFGAGRVAAHDHAPGGSLREEQTPPVHTHPEPVVAELGQEDDLVKDVPDGTALVGVFHRKGTKTGYRVVHFDKQGNEVDKEPFTAKSAQAAVNTIAAVDYVMFAPRGFTSKDSGLYRVDTPARIKRAGINDSRVWPIEKDKGRMQEKCVPQPRASMRDENPEDNVAMTNDIYNGKETPKGRIDKLQHKMAFAQFMTKNAALVEAGDEKALWNRYLGYLDGDCYSCGRKIARGIICDPCSDGLTKQQIITGAKDSMEIITKGPGKTPKEETFLEDQEQKKDYDNKRSQELSKGQDGNLSQDTGDKDVKFHDPQYYVDEVEETVKRGDPVPVNTTENMELKASRKTAGWKSVLDSIEDLVGNANTKAWWNKAQEIYGYGTDDWESFADEVGQMPHEEQLDLLYDAAHAAGLSVRPRYGYDIDGTLEIPSKREEGIVDDAGVNKEDEPKYILSNDGWKLASRKTAVDVSQYETLVNSISEQDPNDDVVNWNADFRWGQDVSTEIEFEQSSPTAGESIAFWAQKLLDAGYEVDTDEGFVYVSLPGKQASHKRAKKKAPKCKKCNKAHWPFQSCKSTGAGDDKKKDDKEVSKKTADLELEQQLDDLIQKGQLTPEGKEKLLNLPAYARDSQDTSEPAKLSQTDERGVSEPHIGQDEVTERDFKGAKFYDRPTIHDPADPKNFIIGKVTGNDVPHSSESLAPVRASKGDGTHIVGQGQSATTLADDISLGNVPFMEALEEEPQVFSRHAGFEYAMPDGSFYEVRQAGNSLQVLRFKEGQQVKVASIPSASFEQTAKSAIGRRKLRAAFELGQIVKHPESGTEFEVVVDNPASNMTRVKDPNTGEEKEFRTDTFEQAGGII